MLITEILSENAEKFPEDIALIEREPENDVRKQMSWKQFDDQAFRFASSLASMGVKKGAKVIQLMTNCIEWLPIYFGILRTGAWAVPLNFRFDSEKIELCTQTSEASVMIFGEEFIERIGKVRKSLDRYVTTYIFTGPDHLKPDYAVSCKDLLNGERPKEYKPEQISTDDSAALYFTSGTTGIPKAVLLTHSNLTSACEIENSHHGQTKDDSFLCIPPLYHTGAKMHWFGNFMVGARSVILKGIDPEWILEVVSQERITIVWLLVPWAHDILNALDSGALSLDDYELDQWRLMHIGAQPVPPSLISRWKKVFPGHEYDTNYGLTESTGPGCVHLGVENSHKVGAIGIPGDGWECMIADSDLNPLPGGETGELLVKGPGVMKEYYRNPQETEKAIVDGWLRTGDVARKDESGFIWLVDRKKDVIITGGENIFPVEIENYLITHPSIKDVGVIGVPDSRLGEVVAAVIELLPGVELSEQQVQEFSKELERYKRPKVIFFDKVPRNPTGKIEKPKLRRKYIRTNRDFKKLLV